MGPVAVSNGRMQDAGDACSEQHLIITNEPASLNVRGFQNLIPANYAARSSGNPTQRAGTNVSLSCSLSMLPETLIGRTGGRKRPQRSWPLRELKDKGISMKMCDCY